MLDYFGSEVDMSMDAGGVNKALGSPQVRGRNRLAPIACLVLLHYQAFQWTLPHHARHGYPNDSAFEARFMDGFGADELAIRPGPSQNHMLGVAKSNGCRELAPPALDLKSED